MDRVTTTDEGRLEQRPERVPAGLNKKVGGVDTSLRSVLQGDNPGLTMVYVYIIINESWVDDSSIRHGP